MIRSLPAYLAATAFAVYGRCESEFIRPGPSSSEAVENSVYAVDDRINVEWKTDYAGDCNLFIWLDYPSVKTMQFYLEILANTTDTSYAWDVNLDQFSLAQGLSEDAIFHFALYASKTNIPLANSAAFNVSGSALESVDKTTSIPTLEPTLTSTTVSQVPEITSQSPTTETSDQPAASQEPTTSQVPKTKSDNSGLSTAALVGISVGVTVVGLLLSGAIGFFLWRRFNQKRNQISRTSSEGPEFFKAELGGTQVLQVGKSELDSTREAQELWDTQKPGELGDENKIRSIVGLHEAP